MKDPTSKSRAVSSGHRDDDNRNPTRMMRDEPSFELFNPDGHHSGPAVEVRLPEHNIALTRLVLAAAVKCDGVFVLCAHSCGAIVAVQDL